MLGTDFGLGVPGQIIKVKTFQTNPVSFRPEFTRQAILRVGASPLSVDCRSEEEAWPPGQ